MKNAHCYKNANNTELREKWWVCEIKICIKFNSADTYTKYTHIKYVCTYHKCSFKI